MAEIKQLDYSSLLYAYALGCLDKEDYLKLNEYLSHSTDFPWQNLGEFQNLVALLPSFLNVEDPPSGLKDRVARKLYRLRETKPVERREHPQAGMSEMPAKAKTMLTEKMRSTSVSTPASQKIADPLEPSGTTESIIAPPEFKSSSPFSQRSGAGARPQQDTQIRSRSEQQTPSSAAQSSSEQASGVLPNNESRFHGAASEEFIINQGFDGFPADIKGKDDIHINFDGFSFPNLEDSFPQTPGSSFSSGSLSEPFSPPITLLPSTFEQDKDQLEEIRKKVVENVEKEQFVYSPPESFSPAQPAKTPKLVYAIIVVLLLSIGGVYFLYTGIITKLNDKVAKTDQSTKIDSALIELKKNPPGRLEPEILAMLSKKDSKTVLLNGTGKFKDSYGKLIVDPKTKEGFLALGYFQLPLQETEYILWVTEGKIAHKIEYNGVLTFSQESIKYTALKNINEFKGPNVKVMLTIEKKGSNPTTPSVQVCLEGLVK